MDLLDHVHPLDHPAERGEPLAVWVPHAAEVQLLLEPTQMKKSDVAVSGPSRAIEIVPSVCDSPVSLVRSSSIGWNSSFDFSGLMPAWTTSIFTLLSGWLPGVTVR